MQTTVLSSAESVTPFDFDPRTRVVFGSGTHQRSGELMRQAKATRVLLVTDSGVLQAGHAEKCRASLLEAGLEVTVFSEVTPNPTTVDVDQALAVAKSAEIDGIVAVGGGSSLDCAKGVNFLFTNGGRMRDYWGIGKATKPMLPMIAVPTTAGTGSEAQSFALIADAETHMKMACGDKKAACKVAILDPDFSISMPASVTAATGIDALSHAVESHVTTKRTLISRLFSRRAWQLLGSSFPAVLRDPSDALARGSMLLGAHFAGAAIENSMLGATHALANPLTAAYDLTHGIAIGILLPHVIRYNASVVGADYGELAADLELCPADDPHAAVVLARFIAEVVRMSGSPGSLQDAGVNRSRLPELAQQAATQWTGTFNPRPVDAKSLLELYESAY